MKSRCNTAKIKTHSNNNNRKWWMMNECNSTRKFVNHTFETVRCPFMAKKNIYNTTLVRRPKAFNTAHNKIENCYGFCPCSGSNIQTCSTFTIHVMWKWNRCRVRFHPARLVQRTDERNDRCSVHHVRDAPMLTHTHTYIYQRCPHEQRKGRSQVRGIIKSDWFYWPGHVQFWWDFQFRPTNSRVDHVYMFFVVVLPASDQHTYTLACVQLVCFIV